MYISYNVIWSQRKHIVCIFWDQKKTVSCGQDRVKTTVVLVVCTGGPVKDKYSCPVKFTASTAAVLDQLDSGSLCTLIPFVWKKKEHAVLHHNYNIESIRSLVAVAELWVKPESKACIYGAPPEKKSEPYTAQGLTDAWADLIKVCRKEPSVYSLRSLQIDFVFSLLIRSLMFFINALLALKSL